MTPGYSKTELRRMALARFSAAFVIVGALLFISAGTIAYWQAWVYIIVLFGAVIIAASHLLRHAPDLVERRMRMREKQPRQKSIITLGMVVFAAVFVTPGLDFRFGWSSVPLPVVLAADILVLLGYALIVLVLNENRYASRIIEVEVEQHVISTGPYAIIRHPMYTGSLVMYLFSPLALGSYWALIPGLALPVIFIARIRSEEALLIRELSGYAEYMQRVRYRLIPGVW